MSKPAVLFLHGAGGGGWEWNIWKRVFQAHGFEVHAPDLFQSTSGLANTSLEDYRRQVQQHLRMMSSPKIIIGASLGGLLALTGAGETEQVDALVLINPMPPTPLHSHMPTRGKYPDIIPWQTNASLQGTRQSVFDADEMTCLYAFRHWRDESGAVMNTALSGVDIVKPTCPVLVMASEKDTDVPFAVTQKLAENLNAMFIHLPETSHVGPLLGKNAAQCALQTVAYLNDIFP
ncbi:MAG: alpha/beta hydrolase [Arenimonas sp.]